jgi:hypothetical protein
LLGRRLGRGHCTLGRGRVQCRGCRVSGCSVKCCKSHAREPTGSSVHGETVHVGNRSCSSRYL